MLVQPALSPTSTGDLVVCSTSKPFLQFEGRAQVAVRELGTSLSTRFEPTFVDLMVKCNLQQSLVAAPAPPLRVRAYGLHDKDLYSTHAKSR